MIVVWLISLAGSAMQEDWLLLDAAETARASRFYREADRNRYVLAHAACRCILGAAIGCRPTDVVFSTAADGKPFLPGSSLRFNLSHSGEHAALAISTGCEVGVDIEIPPPEADRIAPLVLSDAELSAYFILPSSPARAAAFLRVWTRKEAVLKGAGCGLRRDLRSLTIGIEMAADGGLTVELDGGVWHLSDFVMEQEMLGCLATAEHPGQIIFRRFGVDRLEYGKNFPPLSGEGADGKDPVRPTLGEQPTCST